MVVLVVVFSVVVFSISSASVIDVLVVASARASDALLRKWYVCAIMGEWLWVNGCIGYSGCDCMRVRCIEEIRAVFTAFELLLLQRSIGDCHYT